jgi:putative FmdB family regulatory protein
VPIYEFECQACGRLTEVMQKMSDPAPATCPACGGGPLARQVSRTSFHLKGGGWYADLYASPGAKPTAESDAKAEAKADAKSDSKGDAKADAKAKPEGGGAAAPTSSPQPGKPAAPAAPAAPASSGGPSGSRSKAARPSAPSGTRRPRPRGGRRR